MNRLSLNLKRVYNYPRVALLSIKIVFHSISFWPLPLWFMFWLSSAEEKKIVFEGTPIFIRANRLASKFTDLYIASTCLVNKQYTPKGFEIKSHEIIIDIGAHIGCFSVFAGRHAREGLVISYEPAEDNFRQLQKNIQLNGVKAKIFNQSCLWEFRKTSTI